MEKNATVYIIEMDYNKIVCKDKESAIKIFELISQAGLRRYEEHDYSDKYVFIGSPSKIALKAHIVNLYNCKEEARVAKENEEKLIKAGIMKDKRKSAKVKEVKKSKK